MLPSEMFDNIFFRRSSGTFSSLSNIIAIHELRMKIASSPIEFILPMTSISGDKPEKIQNIDICIWCIFTCRYLVYGIRDIYKGNLVRRRCIKLIGARVSRSSLFSTCYRAH
ncbi:uncharacterized protein LOC117205024 [Bombus bifarius]|uniref:Uncharacterized protein LOC117205024 n=1 Tax=Bombus bifarius TaxID=103933 RepID=A0A6P8M8J5_9HYME|nr:uncharacterized protein LOC117205024 [Bombus bifarius]